MKLHGVYIIRPAYTVFPYPGSFSHISPYDVPMFYVRETYISDAYVAYYGIEVNINSSGGVSSIYYRGLSGNNLLAYDGKEWTYPAYKSICVTEPVVLDEDLSTFFSTFAYLSESYPSEISWGYKTPLGKITYYEPYKHPVSNNRIPILKLTSGLYKTYAVESWKFYNETTKEQYGTPKYNNMIYENVTIVANVREKLSGEDEFNGYVEGLMGWGVTRDVLADALRKAYSGNFEDVLHGASNVDFILNAFVFPFEVDVRTGYDCVNLNTSIPLTITILDTDSRSGVLKESNYLKKICTLHPKKIYNDFRDYCYTKIQLYLPFVGFVDLNPNVLYTHPNWYLFLAVDYLTGKGKYYLESGYGFQYGYWDVQIGLSLPLVNSNYHEVVRNGLGKIQTNLTNSIVSGIGAVVTGNPFMGMASIASGAAAIGSTVDVLTQEGDYTVKNSSGDFTQTGMTRVPFIRYTYPKLNNETSFAYVGRVCKKEYFLRELEGYAKIGDIHLENINATQEELDEIVALLKSGVIF